MSRRRSPAGRRRVATGVYRDAYGFDVRVTWRGETATTRFPHGTEKAVMARWRRDALTALQDADPTGPAGSFREVARAYLRSAAFAALETPTDRTRDVQTWVTHFGDTPVQLVTAPECQAVIETWTQTLAPSTVCHRIDALVAVLPRLRAKLRRPAPRPVVARMTPRDRIVRVLQALRPGTTTARLWVLFYTGMRPVQLGRLTAADLDLDAQVLYVPPAKGGRAVTMPLSAEGVQAVRAFIAADAWGQMSRGSANRMLKRACATLGVPPMSLYALRRSFGSTLRARRQDVADVQHLMGHTRPETTIRYAPVVDATLRAAVAELDVVEASGSRRLQPCFGD